MPTYNPAIGELWQEQDALSGGARSTGVIVGVMPHAVQLMARTGRVVSVSQATLRSAWHMILAFQGEACAMDLCRIPACVRNQQGIWYCGTHAPRNQTVYLPGDNIRRDTVEPSILPNCPACGARRNADSPIVEVQRLEEVYHIHRCHCRSQWVVLTARGTPEDGVQFMEDMRTVRGIFRDERCASITALLGQSAQLTLRRTWSNPVSFEGIRLDRNSPHGSSNIVVIGKISEAATGDFFLGILRTYWKLEGYDDRGVLIVIGAEERDGDKRLVQLINVFSTDNDSGEIWTVEERALRDRFTSVKREVDKWGIGYVSSLPAPVAEGAEELERLFAAADRPLPAPRRVAFAEPPYVEPKAEEMWWNADTGDAIYVLGIVYAPEARIVRYSDEKGQAHRMLSEHFCRQYSADRYTAIVVGHEYEDPSGNTSFVVSVDFQTVTLKASDEEKYRDVSLRSFRNAYTRVIRRSIMDRLLGDDDLV